MAKGVIGAQLYTLRDFCKNISEFAETLKKVKDIGYSAVQISGIGDMDPKEVAKVVEDVGINVGATHIGWNNCLDDIDAVIAEHKMWNCKHAAIGGLPGEYLSADGIKKFIDELGPVAEKLAAEGMDFSYHNHSHELARYGEKTWLAMLYEEADPNILKAEIDTYWIQHGGGDPTAWVKKCAGRIPLLHLKDMIITAEREQRYAEIGEGNLNWPSILEAADAAGVEYYLVEQDLTYDRDAFESMAISYRNLNAMGLS